MEKTLHQKISGKFVEVKSEYLHREGTNDYTKHKVIIEEIIDRGGKKVNPAWERDWSEVVSGIETREDSECRYARIYRQACPVRIKFQDYYEYASYDDSEHSSTESKYYWVQYEARSFKNQRDVIKNRLLMKIPQIIQNKLFRYWFCGLGLWISSLRILISFRFLSIPFFLASWWLYFVFLRAHKFRWLLLIWIAFILSTYSPVDVSLKNFPGPPRFVPLVMGLPMAETWERAKRYEVMLGGCVVSGHEPKYILVW